MWQYPNQNETPARTVAVPVADPPQNYGQSAPIDVLATFQLFIRDTLDFSVDLTAWLTANGAAVLSGATWTSAGSKTPTLSGQAFVPTGLASVVVAPASGALPGDAYLLDVAFAIAAVAASIASPAIPARVLTRRICIILVNG